MSLDRRTFLKGTVAAGTLWMAVRQPKGFAATEWHAPKGPTDLYVPTSPYLTADERRFVEAAVDRLIPEDELGPGALRSGVADFIDYQLGGPFGRAARWYMDGPWRDGSEAQGYQMRFTPAELYRHCIPHVNDHCRQTYQGDFADLAAADKDAVLEALERGDIPLDVFDPASFFEILLQNTREGFLADPMYGGNRDFAGWRLAGFPGARYNYSPFITDYGKSFPYPPVGILGRQGIPLKEIM
nr:gluconate 2-dehydrogenase subunit 3 family protein [uncultured Halomonas sp.]